MDQQKKHRRVVSFSDVKQERIEEFTKSRSRMNSESFRQDGSIMKDYNSKESEFTASIAAAAYAIYSLEETRAEFEKRMVESFREDPTSKHNSFRKEIQEDSNFELPKLGSLMRKSSQVLERRSSDVGNASEFLHGDKGSMRKTSTKAIEISGVNHRGGRRVGSKADSWEQARLAKIDKWYEKMKQKIIEWEIEKKKKAEVGMENRKAELERLKRINLHHYQNKVDRIEQVVEGLKKQLEERKKSEEAYAKQRARKIKSTGRLPVQCCCFEY